MLPHNPEKAAREKGVAMLEFAIVGLLLVMVIGFLFDMMVLYFKNQVLVTTVTRGTRSVAVNFPPGFTLSGFNTGEYRAQLNNVLKQRFINHINNNYVSLTDDAQNPPLQVNAQIEQSPGMPWNEQKAGDVQLLVNVEWSNVCVFCFFPIPARASTQAVIEDECFF